MAQGGDIALDMAGHRFIFSGRSSDAFPMPFLLRSSCLTGYVEVARSLGLDPFSLVRAVGIDRSCLFDPDIKIPTDPVVRLLEMSASAARVEDFALRMAETRHFSNLGPLALAARDAATLREALEVAIRYLSLHNEALLLSLEAMGGCRDLQIGNAGRPQLARPPGHRAYSWGSASAHSPIVRRSVEIPTGMVFAWPSGRYDDPFAAVWSVGRVRTGLQWYPAGGERSRCAVARFRPCDGAAREAIPRSVTCAIRRDP